MPINQVGTISVPDPRTISVQVWDKGQAEAVDKAIRESGLGFEPQFGWTINKSSYSGA